MNDRTTDAQKNQAGGHLTQIVFLDESENEPLDDISFDEMNLVELPFALLTRDTQGIYELPLSKDGKSRLACLNSTEYGLPNSLAPHVVLGLMWLWKNECDNECSSFTVKIRELVVQYMYPDRFKTYAPNSDLLRSVETQINCIANSRIHTDRWRDQKLKRRVKANVSIIDAVKVLDEGGPHRPRVLEVTWGKPFFESMVQKYTKSLDARLVQRLDNPVDLALYRLLDRQLARKSRQHYNSIVDLARYKLGMRGKTLDGGGRTASSYVTKKLAAARQRLARAQYAVGMTIDRTRVPFAVTFERHGSQQPGQPPKERDRELVDELVREFQVLAHGVPRAQPRTRFAEVDRSAAKEWLDAYGFEKARWMVQRCVKLQKERHGQRILVFRGLQLYESAASGAYEHHVAGEASRMERQFSEELDTYWSTYRKKLIELFESRTSAEELARLEAEVRENLGREKPDAPRFLVDAHLRSRLSEMTSARTNALSEDEFRAHRSLRSLRDALIERHTVDLLAPSSEGTEGEDALPAASSGR